jgi:hypothetical protein
MPPDLPGLTAIILGSLPQAVIHRSGCLWRLAAGAPPSPIAEEVPEIEFLTPCPDGLHFAYWLRNDECFHLADLTGRQLWKRRINTDRAMVHDIRFSSSGDALACIDDYDGGHRLHLFELTTSSVAEFGPSSHPIGFDPDLLRFVGTRFFPQDPEGAVVDRDGQVTDRIRWPLDGWSSLAILPGLNEMAVFRERTLFWLPMNASKPSAAVPDCLPEQGGEPWTPCTLSARPDLALIVPTGTGLAALVSRTRGVVWRGQNVLRATLHSRRALVHYSEGAVELVRPDGAKELAYQPPPGVQTLAAQLAGQAVRVLECSGAQGDLAFRNLPTLARQ